MTLHIRRAVLLALVCVCGMLAARADIVIGQSVPLSKANVSLGTDIRDGALAWFNQVNQKGGINGEPVRLVTLDDENSVQKAGPNTEKLIREHKALVLFGYASATLSAPALPLAEKHGIPLFAPFTGADAIHERSRLVYTVRANYRDEMRAIVSMWGGVGLTRFAVVHYDDAVGGQNFVTVQKMLEGVKDAKAVSIPIRRNAEVPNDALTRIRRSDAQVIIYTTLAEPIAAIVRQLKAASLFYNMVALSFAGNSQLRDAVGAAGHGLAMTTVVPRYNDASIPLTREYRDAMAASGFAKLSYASFESFIAAKALTEGLRRAGPHPSRESFTRAMASMKRLDLGGYSLAFDREQPHGSHFVELAVLDRNGQFKN
jgi:branched-chain amino acid transport system substrate-binding protein